MNGFGIWLALTIGVTVCACYNVGRPDTLEADEPSSMELAAEIESTRPVIFRSPEEVRKYVLSLNKMMGYSGRHRFGKRNTVQSWKQSPVSSLEDYQTFMSQRKGTN